jgi:hypothetical protein
VQGQRFARIVLWTIARCPAGRGLEVSQDQWVQISPPSYALCSHLLNEFDYMLAVVECAALSLAV